MPVTTQNGSQERRLVIQSRADWKDSKIQLFRDGTKEPVEVAAKESTFVLKLEGVEVDETVNPERLLNRIKVTAFVVPETGKAWVGPTQQYYFEVDDQILAGMLHYSFNGIFLWCENFADTNTKAGISVDALASTFQPEPSELYNAAIGSYETREKNREQKTFLRDVFKWGFFRTHPSGTDQGTGEMSVLELRFEQGQLMLTIHNATLDRTGTVWIDVKTRKLIRAIEGDEQTFPKAK